MTSWVLAASRATVAGSGDVALWVSMYVTHDGKIVGDWKNWSFEMTETGFVDGGIER